MTRGMDRSPRTRPRTSPSARTAPAQRSTSAALESQEQGPGRLSAVRMRHLHDEIDAEGNVLLEGGPEGGDEPALARAAPAQRSAVREGADPQRAFIERRHCEGEAAGLTARVSRGRDTAELV